MWLSGISVPVPAGNSGFASRGLARSGRSSSFRAWLRIISGVARTSAVCRFPACCRLPSASAPGMPYCFCRETGTKGLGRGRGGQASSVSPSIQTRSKAMAAAPWGSRTCIGVSAVFGWKLVPPAMRRSWDNAAARDITGFTRRNETKLSSTECQDCTCWYSVLSRLRSPGQPKISRNRLKLPVQASGDCFAGSSSRTEKISRSMAVMTGMGRPLSPAAPAR